MKKFLTPIILLLLLLLLITTLPFKDEHINTSAAAIPSGSATGQKNPACDPAKYPAPDGKDHRDISVDRIPSDYCVKSKDTGDQTYCVDQNNPCKPIIGYRMYRTGQTPWDVWPSDHGTDGDKQCYDFNDAHVGWGQANHCFDPKQTRDINWPGWEKMVASTVPELNAAWAGPVFYREKEYPFCWRDYRKHGIGDANPRDVCPFQRGDNKDICWDFEWNGLISARGDAKGYICMGLGTPFPTPYQAPCAKYTGGVCTQIKTSLTDDLISTDAAGLLNIVFMVVISLAGGAAVLLIIIAGYKIMTSKGKPEAVQAGREQLTSAIVGLLFIIFSYVIFQFIVVDVIKIPGITN